MECEIFISYKCLDEKGGKTPNYQIGSELYDTLSNLGYNVFFSSDTLEKLGSSSQSASGKKRFNRNLPPDFRRIYSRSGYDGYARIR